MSFNSFSRTLVAQRLDEAFRGMAVWHQLQRAKTSIVFRPMPLAIGRSQSARAWPSVWCGRVPRPPRNPKFFNCNAGPYVQFATRYVVSQPAGVAVNKLCACSVGSATHHQTPSASDTGLQGLHQGITMRNQGLIALFGRMHPQRHIDAAQQADVIWCTVAHGGDRLAA
jgi:hypothetical protein